MGRSRREGKTACVYTKSRSKIDRSGHAELKVVTGDHRRDLAGILSDSECAKLDFDGTG